MEAQGKTCDEANGSRGCFVGSRAERKMDSIVVCAAAVVQ